MKVYGKNNMKANIKRAFFGSVAFTLLLFGLAFSALAKEKFKVITNPACPSLGKDEIKIVFLGYKKVVDGKPVELFISKDETVFSDFVQDVLGLRVSEFKSHWLKRALSGEGTGPKMLQDDEIINAVKSTQCAIGVISKEKDVPDVKVLLGR